MAGPGPWPPLFSATPARSSSFRRTCSMPLAGFCGCLGPRPGCKCSEMLARRHARRFFTFSGVGRVQVDVLSSAPCTPAGTTASTGSDASRHAARCTNGHGANGAAAGCSCCFHPRTPLMGAWACDRAGSPCLTCPLCMRWLCRDLSVCAVGQPARESAAVDRRREVEFCEAFHSES
jgi:hypothetical protein